MWRLLLGVFLGVVLTVGGYVGFTMWQARQAATQEVRAPVKAAGVVAALKEHTKLFRKRIERVTPTVEVAIGYGLANVILIEAPNGLILVDTLESVDAARDLKPWIDKRRRETGKDITHIIYTHNHADHIFGAAVLVEGQQTKPQIWAHPDTVDHVNRVVNVLRDIIQQRSMRQFGVYLTQKVRENAGIGPGLRLDHRGRVHFLHPTHTFKNPKMTLTMSGLTLTVLHAKGETDDQIAIYLPKERVLLPADNFYFAFPNLYAIRGTRYRDVRQWARSIDKMRALKPAVMVPQHTIPVKGAAKIETMLRNYRDAIQYVHDQTVRWMNKGLTPAEIVQKVRLPKHLEKQRYLLPLYGQVDWSVRSVFSGYLGWFSGDPADLEPPGPKVQAAAIAALAGGQEKLVAAAEKALSDGKPAWALLLIRHLRYLGEAKAASLQIRALRAMAARTGNATARNYYLTSAAEAGGFRIPKVVSVNAPAQQFAKLPVENFIRSMQVALKAEENVDTNLAIAFRFTDLKRSVTLTIRRGILVREDGEKKDAAGIVVLTSETLKGVLAGRLNPLVAFAGGDVSIEGSRGDVLRFFRQFERRQ